jgi:preprotein translocase subunit YajC
MGNLFLPLIIVLMGGVLFLSARKQKKAAATQQDLQNNLEPGERVMTSSGLFGTVVATYDDKVQIEIAEGVVTEWLRLAIREKVTEMVDETDEVIEEEAPEVLIESAAEVAPALEHNKK